MALELLKSVCFASENGKISFSKNLDKNNVVNELTSLFELITKSHKNPKKSIFMSQSFTSIVKPAILFIQKMDDQGTAIFSIITILSHNLPKHKHKNSFFIYLKFS